MCTVQKVDENWKIVSVRPDSDEIRGLLKKFNNEFKFGLRAPTLHEAKIKFHRTSQ
jgi:hypothetical protein